VIYVKTRKESSLNIISILIIIIFAVNIVAIASTLTGFGNFGTAEGQGNNITSSAITPEQKAVMCDPDNPLSMLKSVNTTESKVCGIPKTQPSNATISEGNTTPEGIAPSEG
jgi:hypothetical protein